FISGGIADEHIHAHCRVGQHLRCVAGYVAQCDSDLLHISDASQVYRHRVARKDWTSLHPTCTTRDSRAAAHDIATEGKHERVTTVAAAAFHARLTGEWQRNVEGARRPVGLARDSLAQSQTLPGPKEDRCVTVCASGELWRAHYEIWDAIAIEISAGDR